MLDLKSALADILGVRSNALQLVGVDEGCVVIKFHLPAAVADRLFANGLTSKQEADIRALSVLWLKCGGYKLEETPNDADITPANTTEMARKSGC